MACLLYPGCASLSAVILLQESLQFYFFMLIFGNFYKNDDILVYLESFILYLIIIKKCYHFGEQMRFIKSQSFIFCIKHIAELNNLHCWKNYSMNEKSEKKTN
jgi:hypothetical protein